MITDYTAYFDESYSHTPEPLVYTIAGYVSTNVQWKKFQKEWRRQLDGENIDFFHMVDFQACKPPYGDWPKEKRVNFLKSLHEIIHKRVTRSFATTVNIDDFESLTSYQKKMLGNPHIYATFNCMSAIGFWTAENLLHYPMAYVFEQGSRHDKQLRKLFNEDLRDEDRHFFRVGSFELKDKRERRPLQAADILAYETTKEVVRRLTPINPRAVRKSIKNLGRAENDEWRYCNKEELIESVRARLRRRRAYPDSTSSKHNT
ncbi:MAG: hypothetical protein QOJ02_2989 [Acidobacteriota bacterium]|jgi:hypothetical protein|nr:hypothetical protein [Acidobacteriota bacterium]